MTTGDVVPNAEQAQAWNGEEGRRWVAEVARHDRMLAPMTEYLLDAAGIRDGDAVLDAGCGCGETTLEAARRAGRGSAAGADLSALMVAEASSRAERAGLRNVRFVRADAQEHAFPAGSFDVVISRFGVMFFDAPRAAFANLGRALRPGGRLAFLCWQEPAASEFYRVPMAAAARHVPMPAGGGPDDPGPFSLARPGRIRELLAGAGFGAVAIEPVTARMQIGEDVDDVMDYFLTMGIVRAMLAAASAEDGAAADRAVRDALAPYQGPDGVWLAGAAWLVCARSTAGPGGAVTTARNSRPGTS
jgi:SAM-dependent methyltransferase